jgi:hypothetical protein
MSSSTKTTCCHVPKVRIPSTKGTERLGPTNDALTCDRPLSSCHLFWCSYGMLLGETRSSMSVKSSTSPGSYSMVVTAAVYPDTKTVAVPFFNPLSCTAFWTSFVTSTKSFSARLLTSMRLVNTFMRKFSTLRYITCTFPRSGTDNDSLVVPMKQNRKIWKRRDIQLGLMNSSVSHLLL